MLHWKYYKFANVEWTQSTVAKNNDKIKAIVEKEDLKNSDRA